MDNDIRFILRIDGTLFRKFRCIADSRGRSANRELEMIISREIEEYERDNGKIVTDRSVWR